MSVDFFPCDYCGESICDCGPYVHCECGRKWCDKQCAQKEGFRYDNENTELEHSCGFCRNEVAEDSDLLTFILKKFKVSRDEIQKEYLDSVKTYFDE